MILNNITIDTAHSPNQAVELYSLLNLRTETLGCHTFNPAWCGLDGIAELGPNENQLEALWRLTRLNQDFSSELETAFDAASKIHLRTDGTAEVDCLGLRFLFDHNGRWKDCANGREYGSLDELLRNYGRTDDTQTCIALACPESDSGPTIFCPLRGDIAALRRDLMSDIGVDQSWQRFPHWHQAGVGREQFATVRDLVTPYYGCSSYESLLNHGQGIHIAVNGEGSCLINELFRISFHRKLWFTPLLPKEIFLMLNQALVRVYDSMQMTCNSLDGEEQTPPNMAEAALEILSAGRVRPLMALGEQVIPLEVMKLGLEVFGQEDSLQAWLDCPTSELGGRIPRYLVQTDKGEGEVRQFLLILRERTLLDR